MSKFKLRYYQDEVIKKIKEYLETNDKGLVKMFCGTGKSIVEVKIVEFLQKTLSVYVFPSLALINQFYRDYVQKYKSGENVLIVCSEIDSSETTTDKDEIKSFLKKGKRKIILVTYQSFKVLLDSLEKHKIGICCFDEAHHAVGNENQKLIFNNDSIEKSLFFTATPKNTNGIIMHDFNNVNKSDCGDLIYDYSYYSGCNDDYLNPFEIRIDMYLENTNKSIYESIARSIIKTGNTRVLTFHSTVSESNESKTSVRSFVDYEKFIEAFYKVLENEFYDEYDKWIDTDITFIGIDASTKNRSELLNKFEECRNDQIFIISSCETIGEGIDTKNANMCVFVDPKTSYVKIIQNIGRIVRIKDGEDIPNSTVLIPCWVDKSKYEKSSGNKERQDQVIREDMQKDGNFNGILNVMSALKQEDEELFNQCLNYSDIFSQDEINKNLNKQGFKIINDFEENDLISCVEYLIEDEIDLDNYSDEENIFMEISKDKSVSIEIHNNSLEESIKVYGNLQNKIRLYKSEDDEFYPIIKKKSNSKKSKDNIKPPSKKKGFIFNVYTNDEIKVLWNIKDDLDIFKDISSCVIDCEIIAYDPMEIAKKIVKRAYEREKNSGKLLPRRIDKKYRKNNKNIEQENKDAITLERWKMALKNKRGKISNEIEEYLNKYLPKWSYYSDEKALYDAKNIVKRAKEREMNGEKLLPRRIKKKKNNTTLKRKQENDDAVKIERWKYALKNKGTSKCSNEIKNYLDINLPGWRDNFDKKEIKNAEEIVKRAKKREDKGENLLPKKIRKKEDRKTPELEQENSDANKLNRWKKILKEENNNKYLNDVKNYLNEHLPYWQNYVYEKEIKNAKEIVKRAKKREDKGENLLPKKIYKKEYRKNSKLKQEDSDANKLNTWKGLLKKEKYKKYLDEIKDYLDKHLPYWRPDWKPIIEKITEEISEIKPIENSIKKKIIKKKSMKLKTKSSNDKIKEIIEQKQKRIKSELSTLHQKYKTYSSDNLQKIFTKDPELWKHYHNISEENEKSFPEDEIPRNRIIKKLNERSYKKKQLVVDLGCGKAEISKYFKNDDRYEFINYDHYAYDKSIEKVNIKSIPLENNSVDICILSLSMWGSDCSEYIEEANKVLDTRGILYIIEPTKRWTEKDVGDKLEKLINKNNFIIIKKDIEKFALFECLKY